jgi:hypothetical protein
MKRYAILIIVLCVCIGGIPLFAKDKKVIAEGVGDNTAKGRQDAHNDALRKAIEKAVGTYVSVEARVENKQLIEEKIYTRNQAYISSSKVLDKGVNKDGLYFVKIEALVKEGKIKDDIKAFEIIKRRKGNPRLMVIAKVTEKDNHWYSNPDANGIRSRIESRLLRKKFKVVDIDQVRNIKRIEAAAAAGDSSQLKALVQQYGAEIIVTSNVSKTITRTTKLYGRKTTFFSLDLSMKAVIADTAQMIYSNSSQVKETGDFTEIHENVTALAKEMVTAIQEKWQSDVFNEATFELKALEVSYQDVQLLKEALQYSVGIGTVIERSFGNKVAVLELGYAGTSEQFGLLLADMEDPSLKVVARSANKFSVKFGKPAGPPRDTTAPNVRITVPKDGAVVSKDTSKIAVKGNVDDPEVQTVEIGNMHVKVKEGRFATTVSLKSGANRILASGKDKAGNVGTAAVTVTLDDKPPFLKFKVLDFDKRTFSGQIEPGAVLKINGKKVPTDKNGFFKIQLESTFKGKLNFVVEDAAGNTNPVSYDPWS